MHKLIATLAFVSLTIFTPANALLRAQSGAESHLNKATDILAAIPAETELVARDKSANEKAADEVAKLRRQFADLTAGYNASRGAAGSELDWKQKFSEVERTLVRIIGGGVAFAPTKGIRDLNPSVRRQLEAFRTELELLWVAPANERNDLE